jgi:hypothetical protein
MRTWKVTFVPFWRIGESGAVVSAEAGVSGCERIVTRGTKEFQLGHVDVSVRTSQTRVEGALMKIELPRWRLEDSGVMVGVGRSVFVGFWSVILR